jgi:hypothetical protein
MAEFLLQQLIRRWSIFRVRPFCDNFEPYPSIQLSSSLLDIELKACYSSGAV